MSIVSAWPHSQFGFKEICSSEAKCLFDHLTNSVLPLQACMETDFWHVNAPCCYYEMLNPMFCHGMKISVMSSGNSDSSLAYLLFMAAIALR